MLEYILPQHTICTYTHTRLHRLLCGEKITTSSSVSLFDRLHNCYVEYNQNSSDKSSDKVYTGQLIYQYVVH